MPFNEFKTLKVGTYQLKKLVRASDGAILFNAIHNIVPATTSMSNFDFSGMYPNTIYFLYYRNGQYYTDVTSTSKVDHDGAIWYYGNRGSVYLEYKITYDANKTPLRIVNYSQLGTQRLNMLPSEGYEIDLFASSGRDVKYEFTNPFSETDVHRVNVSWNNYTTTQTQLTLDGMQYKDDAQNVVLTIGDGFVGYSGEGFQSDPTYDFNEHSGEQFILTSIDKRRQISFMIG